MPGRRPRLQVVKAAEPQAKSATSRSNSVNLIEAAYEKIEALIVSCELAPGAEMSMQHLQDLTGLGRTPVHHAVNRLALDTLIVVRPRHGIRIAPIDLARERLLLGLRKDMERFVIELATKRATASHRNQMLHLERILTEQRETMTIDVFNEVDRRLDKLMLVAGNEPFLEHTMRPLHTIFRRAGWLYHRRMPDGRDMSGTIDAHLAILQAVANGQVRAAVKASDRLMGHMDRVFERLEAGIDPSLLDSSIKPFKDFAAL